MWTGFAGYHAFLVLVATTIVAVSFILIVIRTRLSGASDSVVLKPSRFIRLRCTMSLLQVRF